MYKNRVYDLVYQHMPNARIIDYHETDKPINDQVYPGGWIVLSPTRYWIGVAYKPGVTWNHYGHGMTNIDYREMVVRVFIDDPDRNNLCLLASSISDMVNEKILLKRRLDIINPVADWIESGADLRRPR